MNSSQPLHKPADAGYYPASWSWSRLDDVCEAVIDCPHSTPDLTSVGPLVARSQDIRSGVLDVKATGHVSEATYAERIARAEPRHGDLLYSREGTYFGIAAEVPEGVRVCLGQRMVLIRPRRSQVNSRYLKYWLNSPAIASHIHGFRDGSVAERLNLPTIRGLPIVLPPLHEQNRIADTLGSLDDKIEFNRCMNRTLESIARTTFKSLFVDFKPLPRGSAGGDPAGTDWPVVPFADTVEVLSGGTPRTSEPDYWDGDIPWYSVADAPAPGDVFVIQTEKTITDLAMENSAAQVVPPLTTVISARGTVGKCALSGQPMAFNQSCFGLRPADDVGVYYTYFSTLRVVDQLRRSAHGSVFNTITRATFAAAVVPLPPLKLVSDFEGLAEPLMKRVLLNAHESEVLRRVRDALLSRLLSGFFLGEDYAAAT